MKKKQKNASDLSFENSLKAKDLNQSDYQLFEKIQKYVFQHQKDILKANIILSTILDELNELSHQKKKNLTSDKSMKDYVHQVEKSIKMSDKIKEAKKQSLDKYAISGLWVTMCGYIALLFLKEVLTQNYLIHFSIDGLIAIVAFYVALHNGLNQYKLIQQFNISMKPLVMVIVSFVVGIFVVLMTLQSPFDISFLILVIGYISGKKIFTKLIEA